MQFASSTSTLVGESLARIDSVSDVKSFPESTEHDLSAMIASYIEEVPKAASTDPNGAFDKQLLLRAVLAVSSLNARFDILKDDIDTRLDVLDREFTSCFEIFRCDVLDRLAEVEKAPAAQYAAVRKELQDVRQLVIGKALEIGGMKRETREERTARVLEGCRQRAETIVEAERAVVFRQPTVSPAPPMSPIVVGNKAKVNEEHVLRDITLRSQAKVENVYNASITFLSPSRVQSSSKGKGRASVLTSSPKQSTPKGKGRFSAMVSPFKCSSPVLSRSSMVQKENVPRERIQTCPPSVRRPRPTSALPRPSGLPRHSRKKSLSKFVSKLRMPGLSLLNTARDASKNAGPSDANDVLTQVPPTVVAPRDEAEDSLCLLNQAMRDFEKNEGMLTSVSLPRPSRKGSVDPKHARSVRTRGSHDQDASAEDSLSLLDKAMHDFKDEGMLTSIAISRPLQQAGPSTSLRTRNQRPHDDSFQLRSKNAHTIDSNPMLTDMSLPLNGNDSSLYLDISTRATTDISILTSLALPPPSILVTSPTFEL